MDNKTLIYCSVFFNKAYLNLFKLLMCSIKFYTDYEKYDFLLLTSEDYANDVKQISDLVDIPIKTHFLDINSFFHAAAARCRIFEYPDIDQYKYILYLDTDIIIHGDISNMIYNIDKDILYGLEDGIIGFDSNGVTLFQKGEFNYNDPAINSGVLLFQNTEKIRKIMVDCNNFLLEYKLSGKKMPSCLEQPFINYFFYKEKYMNSQYLKKYVSLNDMSYKNIEGQVLCIKHFIAPIGNATDKLVRIKTFLNDELVKEKDTENLDIICNRKYSWENNGYIIFNKDNILNTKWGKGSYNFLDKYIVHAQWCGYKHYLKFNQDYTKFLSIRYKDCETVNGIIESEISKEYDTYSNQIKNILNELRTIIVECKSPLEGNCFYNHNTLNLNSSLYTKQINLFWAGKQAKTRICEIGFNAGFSTMLMLLGREKTPLEFTVFDIGHHDYTKPCFNHIKNIFTNVNFEYIEGDSTITMPIWIDNNKQHLATYDIIHVDGGHSEYCIINDMKNTDILIKIGGIIIIDDTWSTCINNCVNQYISSGCYKELNLLKTYGYPHRAIQKIKDYSNCVIITCPLDYKNNIHLKY